jgi:hypothetical protein
MLAQHQLLKSLLGYFLKMLPMVLLHMFIMSSLTTSASKIGIRILIYATAVI